MKKAAAYKRSYRVILEKDNNITWDTIIVEIDKLFGLI